MIQCGHQTGYNYIPAACMQRLNSDVSPMTSHASSPRDPICRRSGEIETVSYWMLTSRQPHCSTPKRTTHSKFFTLVQNTSHYHINREFVAYSSLSQR